MVNKKWSSVPALDLRSERQQFIMVFLLVFLLMIPLLASLRLLGSYSLYYTETNLASGFLNGHLYADDLSTKLTDTIYYHNHYYLPFGPFTSVLEMPFVALFGADFSAVLLQFALTLLNVGLLWYLLTVLDVAGEARPWLVALFFVGALYIPNASFVGVWYLIQVLTVTLMLGALVLAEKGYWLASGLVLGCAVATKYSMLVSLSYFVLLIVLSSSPRARSRWRDLILLGLGVIGPLLLLLYYNYARFGSPFETGYALSIPVNPLVFETRQAGIFNINHIPTSFFFMFVNGFDGVPSTAAPTLQFPWIQPSPRGMSIFITTPALIYLFRAPIRSGRAIASAVAILLNVITLLVYYYTGAPQYGYRYFLDFMPIIFVLLVAALRHLQADVPDERLVKLDLPFKILVVISMMLGVWGLMTSSAATVSSK